MAYLDNSANPVPEQGRYWADRIREASGRNLSTKIAYAIFVGLAKLDIASPLSRCSK